MHGPRFRRVLRQRQVRPGFVILRQEGLHVPVQGGLMENNHVIEALAAKGADDAFHVGTLPRGSRCRQNFLDSHGFHILPKLTAEDPVAVPKQVICSKGKASRSCCAAHSSVGWAVTLKWMIFLRS